MTTTSASCSQCNEDLDADWNVKFPQATVCQECAPDPPADEEELECSLCGGILRDHHEETCPCCGECQSCDHLMAFDTTLFESDGPQLYELTSEQDESIDALIEAHEGYLSAFYEAKERFAGLDTFTPLWTDFQKQEQRTLEEVYGESWAFTCGDDWQNEHLNELGGTLLLLLRGEAYKTKGAEGGGAAGACWESCMVYTSDPKGVISSICERADKWAKALRAVALAAEQIKVG